MQKLTCDEAIMKQITLDTQDYTNNEKAMEEIASSDYKSDFLGGQNHIALFAEAAKKIDMSNAGPYDQGLNESFQTASRITSPATWMKIPQRQTSRPPSRRSIRS